ncbi:MAG: cysteine desulfurase-like protein [Planctomycetes bacterium]|nr:cysteine desulfurase-like protein [Planctomycetota bacterium]
MGSAFDVDRVRKDFPALLRRCGEWLVGYFDGPGGTQIPRSVADAMVDYLFHHNANTHWAFPTSEETDGLLANARATFADFFACSSDEVVFGNNMTSLTFHLARAIGRRLEPGDEIVVTELDHQANVGPWRALEKERGVTVRVVPFRVEDATLDPAAFDAVLGAKTRVVAVGAASNATGTVNDLATILGKARAVNALTFVDAVHYAPHGLIDVKALDCDFLACSSYKFYGPHAGILYGKREWLQSLDVPKLLPASDEAPERFETGTQNHEGIVGAAAAVQYLARLGTGETRRERLESAYERIEARGQALIERLWYGLEDVPGVSLFGPDPSKARTPTVAFRIENRSPREVAEHLASDYGLYLSDGDFYATSVIERLGFAERGGVLRAGCALYTTEEEVDRLVAAASTLAGS